MSDYTVTFERVGRRHDVPPLEVAGDPDEIAEQVYRYARRFLGSKDVFVSVDLEQMTGSINAARFGTFTLAPAVTA